MPVGRSPSVPGESPADCFKTKVMKNRVNVSLCWRQDGQVENKEETLNGAITCRNNFEDPMASITALNYTRSERRSFPFDEKNHGDKDLFQRLPSSHHDTSTNSKGTVRILEDPMVSITALNYTRSERRSSTFDETYYGDKDLFQRVPSRNHDTSTNSKVLGYHCITTTCSYHDVCERSRSHQKMSSSVCKMSNQCTKSLTHHLKIVAGHCKYDCITIPPSYHDFSTREFFRRKGNARKIFGNFTWYHSHGTWYHHTLYNTPMITTFTYHRSRSAHQRMSSSESFECAKYMTHHLTIIAWHRNHDRIAISTSCHDFSTREFGCSKGNAHIFLYTSQQNKTPDNETKHRNNVSTDTILCRYLYNQKTLQPEQRVLNRYTTEQLTLDQCYRYTKHRKSLRKYVDTMLEHMQKQEKYQKGKIITKVKSGAIMKQSSTELLLSPGQHFSVKRPKTDGPMVTLLIPELHSSQKARANIAEFNEGAVLKHGTIQLRGLQREAACHHTTIGEIILRMRIVSWLLMLVMLLGEDIHDKTTFIILVAMLSLPIDSWAYWNNMNNYKRELQSAQYVTHKRYGNKWYNNSIIDYGNVWDSTKGYPGEGPHNNNIDYGKIFDSTKGYPGEGPGNEQKTKLQRKGGKSKLWSKAMSAWGHVSTQAAKIASAPMYIGHDLFYKKGGHMNWNNVNGGVVQLNMNGWGSSDGIHNRALFANLAWTKTLVVILIDHRRTAGNISSLEYEIENAWTGGGMGSGKVKWAHATARNKHVGGVTIGLHPIIARYASNRVRCDKWGRWVEIDIVGKKGKVTTIVATYGPTGSSSSGDDAMWTYQQKEIHKEGKKRGTETNPRNRYMADLEIMLKKHRSMNKHTILMGDMNINWNGKKKETGKWKQILKEQQMINTMERWWPGVDVSTYRKGGNESWIDHMLVSKELIQTQAVCGTGIETGHGFYTSDHNMSGIKINLTKLLGKQVAKIHRNTDTLARTLQCTDKKLAELYKESLSEIECEHTKKQGSKNSVINRVQNIYDKALEHKRTLRGQKKSNFTKKANKANRSVVKLMLMAEKRMERKLQKFGGRNKRHYWSDYMVQKQTKMNMLKQLIKTGTVRSKRHRITKVIEEIKKSNITQEMKEHLEMCPKTEESNRKWDEYCTRSREYIRQLQKELGSRIRRKEKLKMGAKIKRRLYQYKNNRELGSFLRYAAQRSPNQALPSMLFEYKNDGTIKVLDQPEQVKKKNEVLTRNHMGEGRLKYFIHKGQTLLELRITKRHKTKWIKQVSECRSSKAWKKLMKNIPSELQDVYKTARKRKDIDASIYGDIFTSEITLEMLDKYLGKKKKNTAPGVSGIRIDHIAALPTTHRKMIAQLLSLPYLTGTKYADWNEEIVNWIPKVEGDDDMTKRRPLMYYEVLRKMCIGIKKGAVISVWHKHNLIDKDNFAFLQGLSTTEPLMIKKMILEDAKYWKKDLCIMDVDFSKAYDSTEHFAKEFSLRRMAFPEEGLELWRMYDNTRNMRVLTAHGLTKGVTPECGCWGQGAEESPYGWLAFMCWMSVHIKNKAGKAGYVTGEKRSKRRTKLHKVIYAVTTGHILQNQEKACKRLQMQYQNSVQQQE